MSLPNYLSNIKSSGIYRFVWDKSEIPGAQADTLRLVVGYSDRGPFNTPVYVKDAAEFKTIYGNVSKKLERYGSWFHRMAIQALKKGPILALNLKPFENEEVEGVSFNPQTKLGENIKLAVEELYNTDRFWTLEPEVFENIEDTEEKYISIFATDSLETSNTIFVRGYHPKGYDVTFKTWYSSVLNGENLPPYLDGYENEVLADYFAEIYVFRGEFTPAIATNDKLSKYFDVNGNDIKLKPYLLNAFGEKIDTLEALAANDASNFIKSYHGILLPDFLSSSNTVISLDAQFNQDNYLHKMMMRMNQAALYEGKDEEGNGINLSDLNTTGFLADPGVGMMSLTELDPQISIATYTDGNWNYSEVDGVSVDMYQFDGLTIEKFDDNSVLINKEIGNTGIRKGDRFKFESQEDGEETASMKLATLTKVEKFELDITKAVNGIAEIKGQFKTEEFKTEGDATTPKVTYNFTPEMIFKPNMDTIAPITSDLANFLANYHEVSKIETIRYDATGQASKEFTWNPKSTLKGSKYESEDGTTLVSFLMLGLNTAIMKVVGPEVTTKWMEMHPDGGIIDPEQDYDGFVKFVTETPEFQQVFVDVANKYINDPTKKVKDKNLVFNLNEILFTAAPVIEIVGTNELEYRYKYTFDKLVEKLKEVTSLTKCVNSITYTSANLVPTYIKGYTYTSGKPASTKQIDKLKWQNRILDVLGYKGIRTALTSRVDVDYRYIVDTFESFVEANCKGKITSIAKEKDNAFALVNFPAMSSFSKCEYISFRDNNGVFDTKYIPMGGNPQKVMSSVFSLASEEDGASYASYNTCLNIKDVNTNIKFTCPSAALVSNLYMDKYTKYFPYTIVAGPNRAVVRENGLIGPDFNFSREDLDNLEPFGVNCMVMVPGKGTYINSNQTAKQNPVTTLSKINVRELCIFLQDEIEKLLQQYQWDFNTPNLRNTIKDRADVILETAKNNGGVYRYINVCDESNNTEDVINNEMFVLSTSIEPGIGAGKMVQELTLYRKGGMSSLIKD